MSHSFTASVTSKDGVLLQAKRYDFATAAECASKKKEIVDSLGDVAGFERTESADGLSKSWTSKTHGHTFSLVTNR